MPIALGAGMDRARFVLVWLICLAPGAGCAVLAKKTPTPAAQLTVAELAQIQPVTGEHFYLLVFGSHDPLRRPANTHTWATLVRAIDQAGGAPPQLEVDTISWLPSTLDIHPLRFRIEPGANVDLQATIQNSLRTNQRIALWGPYELSPSFAHRFLMQKQFLESGAVGYQCVDNVGESARTGLGCDCIHAITDMDPIYPRWRYPLFFYGQSASEHLVRRLMHSPIFINPPLTHDWLLAPLGLNDYPIEQRTYRGRVIPYQPGAAGLQANVLGRVTE